VLVAGSLTFAAGELLYTRVVTTQPQYLSHWLPAALLVGLGVALTFPVLSAAAVSGLPAERFGVGGAINQTARQLGAVLGVALLVALLGTPSSPADAMSRFRRVWLMAAAAAFVSAAISLGHARRANVVIAEPVLVADAVAA
jgi:phosphoglycerol transferase MdoB-like AlkP superfamily enzyme